MILNLKIRKRWHKILLILLVLLIAFRIALPFIVVKYVNKVLAESADPYQGRIEDVDIFLLTGSYRICEMKLDLVEPEGKKPFVHAPVINLSVQWKSLIKGALVGEVVMEKPIINFKLSNKADSQTGKEADWVQLAKDLMPIQINRFAILNGQINFSYIDGKSPDFKMDFQNFDLEITNIRNVEEKNKALPSTVAASADAIGYGGRFQLDGSAMLLKTIPDFNYNARFENAQLTSMNELFRYWTRGMDFEQGTLSLYSEMAMKDGRYRGYFKPILHDAKIFKWKEEDRSFKEGVKEFFSEGVQEFFENHKKDQSAARVPIEGTIEAGQPDVWAAIVSSFINAYIRVFKLELDNTIDFSDEFEVKDKGEKVSKEE